MMARREFSTAVRVAAFQRANGHCETLGCGAKLFAGRWQLDHVIPDGMGGEPVLSNAQCLCEACWSVKNPKDATAIAKAKRNEANHIGARLAPAKKIQSAGFPRTSTKRRVHPMPAPPRRGIEGDVL